MKSFQLFFTFFTWMTISQAVTTSGSTTNYNMMDCIQKTGVCKQILPKNTGNTIQQRKIDLSPLAAISRW
ncbi:MAG: hypothetical protein V4717_19340 [Bacteroidota bacterium]